MCVVLTKASHFLYMHSSPLAARGADARQPETPYDDDDSPALISSESEPDGSEVDLSPTIGRSGSTQPMPAAIGADLSSDERKTLREIVMRYTRPCRVAPASPAEPLDPMRLAPNLEGLPWVQAHAEPPIYTCDGFLSDAECDALILAGTPGLRESQVGSDDPNLKRVEGGARRTSSSALLEWSHVACVPLLRKVLNLTGKTREHLEPLQVTRYREGEQYTEHHDCAALSDSEPNAAFLAQGGQRLATVLVYLNHVQSGGDTTFPRIGFSCTPRKGRCLLFLPGVTDGRRDESLLHAALPAVDEKWVCQVWTRQHADPRSSLNPPRWPHGCSTYVDLYRFVVSDGDPHEMLKYFFQQMAH
jgi:prolyl 4-hydroxylase